MVEPEYTNDPTILDNDELWRRVFPGWWIWDENLDRVRPTSQVFQNSKGSSAMSVFLANEIGDPVNVLEGYPDYVLASITADLARQCRQGVARDTNPEKPAHALVFGKKTGSVKDQFANGATWVVPPPP